MTCCHLDAGRWRLRAALFSMALVVVGGAFASREIAAQESEAAPLATERDRQYDDLAEQVAALERQGNLLTQVVKLVRPTVVHIEATKAAEGNQRNAIEEAGSGVIIQIDANHYVLTNRHVIKHASLDKIKIKLSDSRLLKPKQMWLDRGTDIAMMEIEGPNLTPARLGNSDKLDIGDFVLAVGSPFGLSHSVSFGIVSAKGRRDLQLGDDGIRYQDFLQTDAAINPGNSGGPLVNLRGEVVGINTAIASSSGRNEGIGFSIPINMAKVVARQLVQNGEVVRAFLGVQLDSSFGPEMAARLGLPRPEGARVSGVTPQSPAANAELQAGDIILRFNDRRVEDDAHLVNLVSLTPVGTEVTLNIYRGGANMIVKVKVGNRADFEP